MPRDDQVSQETQGEGDERIVCLDRLVLRVLLLCVILLVGLHLLVHNLPWAPQFAAPDSQVRLFFDLASEANLWAWFNVAVLAAGGVMHLVAGLMARANGAGPTWPWLVSGMLLAGLSIDDLTSLHERLQPLGVHLGGGSGLTYAAWLIPGLFFAAVVIGAVATLAVRVPTRPRRLLPLGLALLIGGAFLLESAGNAVLEAVGPSTRYAVFLIAEEMAEACGAVLLLAAACAALRVAHVNGNLTLSYRSKSTG